MRKIIACILFSVALNASSASADFDAGLTAANRNDYATALKEWRPLAEQGNVAVQYFLGSLYFYGKCVPMSYKEAAKWFRRAADQGLASAQGSLGLMYKSGQGVSRNGKQAAKWLRLAAEQGDANAQSNLGLMYAEGQEVPMNYKEAAKWLRLAADQGDATAQTNLGLMYAEGRGVPQNYKEAVNWFRPAAEQGAAEAQTNLGATYTNGRGVKQSRVVAYALYKLAATNGSPDHGKKAARSWAELTEKMTSREIEAAQELARKMSSPGELLKALDQYVVHPAVKEISKPVAIVNVSDSVASADSYPARPATVPGRVSCNTRCENAACYRTYDDGRKVHFQTKQNAEPLENTFVFESGSC